MAVIATGCPTPQACVKECPTNVFSGLALAKDGQETEAKEGMRPHCFDLPEDQWNQKSAQQLIEEGLCPAWVLPSRPYLGRCLPLGEAGNSTEPKYAGEGFFVNEHIVRKMR